MINKLNKILINLLKAQPGSLDSFSNLKKKFSGELGLAPVLNANLLEALNKLTSKTLKQFNHKIVQKLRGFLTVRQTRTLSGVTPITVLTKPFWCPGKCLYCPLEPGMPKSYLSNEPAAQRAKGLNFDPFKQTKLRIKALELNGHQVDKIELLVLGGSWSVYDKKYQEWFIKRCFDAANGRGANHLRPTRAAQSLAQAQKINETAKYRIIGITLETRPDLINEAEVKRMRALGATRVQMGVQHLDDKVLAYVKRGHTTTAVITATKLLKQAGFKVDYHLMPDLPGSTPTKDLKMFKRLFSESDFQPDQIKIYPTVVNQFAPLYRLYQSGAYKPYSEKQLLNLLLKIKLTVPYYVRINRLIRDIPKESIVAGNKITNLRQSLHQLLVKKGEKLARRSLGEGGCKCMRCREAKEDLTNITKAKLFTIKYRASDGWEYFVSYESPKRDKLYSFLRFRINDVKKNFVPELSDAALVRELHTYGKLIPASNVQHPKSSFPHPASIQHQGFGKRLMKIAEQLAKQHHLKKIAVISGIGVRQYYKKLGYRLEGTYMIKKLK